MQRDFLTFLGVRFDNRLNLKAHSCHSFPWKPCYILFLCHSISNWERHSTWHISSNNAHDDLTPTYCKSFSLSLLTVHKVYDLNCTLFINNFLKCNYLPDVIVKIFIHFEYHEFNTKGWDLSKRVKIVRLRICQRAFLNFGMHIWSSLSPEIKHSTPFHEIK